MIIMLKTPHKVLATRQGTMQLVGPAGFTWAAHMLRVRHISPMAAGHADAKKHTQISSSLNFYILACKYDA